MIDFITFASGAVLGGAFGFLGFSILNSQKNADKFVSERIYREALSREAFLRDAEAKRIAHLRSIASSGGKAKAAKRKA